MRVCFLLWGEPGRGPGPGGALSLAWFSACAGLARAAPARADNERAGFSLRFNSRVRPKGRIFVLEGFLQQPGDEGGGAARIIDIDVTELRAHPVLFEAKLVPEGEEDQDEGDESAELPGGDGTA